MKCKICGIKIKKNNNGFSELLNNDENKKLLNLKHDETICLDCKSTILYLNIINPF